MYICTSGLPSISIDGWPFIALIVQQPWQKFCLVFVSLSGALGSFGRLWKVQGPRKAKDARREVAFGFGGRGGCGGRGGFGGCGGCDGFGGCGGCCCCGGSDHGGHGLFSFLCRGLSAVLAAFGKFKVPGRPRTHVARSPSDSHKHLWMVQSAGSSKDRRRKGAFGRSGRLSLASSLAKSTQKSIQNRFREAPGHPKSTQKSVPGPLGTPRGAQERTGSVSDPPPDVPGAPQERPESS